MRATTDNSNSRFSLISDIGIEHICPLIASDVQAAGSQTGVLFVCLGNICRSPTAEAVFHDVVSKAGVADNFVIDSCGTGGGNPGWYKDGGWSYHEGMVPVFALLNLLPVPFLQPAIFGPKQFPLTRPVF